MSKKHFIKIAEIISDNKAGLFKNPLSQKLSLIDNLGNYFKSINSNFDKEKFSSACLGGRLYVSEEDKLMQDKNIKWTKPSIIKSYESK
tara:strand:- start:541 stop:807 length:267 start_codon:yes stop_codon:yes gene_type:complete